MSFAVDESNPILKVFNLGCSKLTRMNNLDLIFFQRILFLSLLLIESNFSSRNFSINLINSHLC